MAASLALRCGVEVPHERLVLHVGLAYSLLAYARENVREEEMAEFCNVSLSTREKPLSEEDIEHSY